MPRSTPVRQSKSVRYGIHLFQNRRTLLQMLRETLKGHYRMSLLTLIILTASIAYVIFPFDFVPDFIPVLGWLDDGLVIYLLLRRLNTETQRYNRFKAMERRNGY